ncbi:hypothetical protein PG996_004760 [Apiospora saccharicola]|uniref:Uncharacterized protein n=1 Tax=Apiospora saccharicola TaxID=335842 RepID=A0ABR1W7V5_9PEZI
MGFAPSEEAIETAKTITTPNVLHSSKHPANDPLSLQVMKLPDFIHKQFLQYGDERSSSSKKQQIYIREWDAGCGGVTRICGSGDRARRGDVCCPGAINGWLPSGLGALLRGVMGCGWDSRR